MYKEVKIIEKNKNLKVKPIKNFKYAKDLTQCIVTIDEFYKACKSFPIVFGRDSENNLVAIAIMGIENKNVFVNSKGEWRKGEYIPFYVRRYPFNFLKQKDKFILVYDENSKAINEKEGEALFDENNEPTDYMKRILTLLEGYQISAKKTEEFLKKIEKLDLFEDARINIQKDSKNYVITPVKKINEEKLNNLKDEDKLELVNSGMYKLIVAHLISLDNINKIAIL